MYTNVHLYTNVYLFRLGNLQAPNINLVDVKIWYSLLSFHAVFPYALVEFILEVVTTAFALTSLMK